MGVEVGERAGERGSSRRHHTRTKGESEFDYFVLIPPLLLSAGHPGAQGGFGSMRAAACLAVCQWQNPLQESISRHLRMTAPAGASAPNTHTHTRRSGHLLATKNQGKRNQRKQRGRNFSVNQVNVSYLGDKRNPFRTEKNYSDND